MVIETKRSVTHCRIVNSILVFPANMTQTHTHTHTLVDNNQLDPGLIRLQTCEINSVWVLLEISGLAFNR